MRKKTRTENQQYYNTKEHQVLWSNYNLCQNCIAANDFLKNRTKQKKKQIPNWPSPISLIMIIMR